MKGVLIGVAAATTLQLIVMSTLKMAGFVESYWILYCTIGVLTASALIYVDLYVVMLAGKHAWDEYILCSVLLYIDIIRLFMYLLKLLG